MEGANELHLCEAEMIQAVEHYLKTKVLNAEYAATVKVLGVERHGNAYEKGFVVKLESVKMLDPIT